MKHLSVNRVHVSDSDTQRDFTVSIRVIPFTPTIFSPYTYPYSYPYICTLTLWVQLLVWSALNRCLYNRSAIDQSGVFIVWQRFVSVLSRFVTLFTFNTSWHVDGEMYVQTLLITFHTYSSV